MSRAPTYDWRCHRCDGINASGTAECSICGFGAIASTDDVSRNLILPTRWEHMKQEGIPPWKRALSFLGWGMGLILLFGGLMALTQVYFLTSLMGMAWSGAVALLGVLILWLTFLLNPRVF